MNEQQKELFEQPRDVEPEVWQPKVEGESIEGILIRKCSPEHDVSARYYLDLFGSGTKLLWGTAVLDQRMALVEIGDYVKVTYKGKVKTKDSKREVHIWKVESAKRKEGKNQLF